MEDFVLQIPVLKEACNLPASSWKGWQGGTQVYWLQVSRCWQQGAAGVASEIKDEELALCWTQLFAAGSNGLTVGHS